MPDWLWFVAFFVAYIVLMRGCFLIWGCELEWRRASSLDALATKSNVQRTSEMPTK